MNKEIKAILGKHNVVIVNSENTFNKALIEICELQKKECEKNNLIHIQENNKFRDVLCFATGDVKIFPSKKSILNTKNIAE